MGQFGGRDFKKGGGKADWITKDGNKGIPPGMPTGKTDTSAAGKTVYLSRQGDKGITGLKGKTGGGPALD